MLLHTLQAWSDPDTRRKAFERIGQAVNASAALAEVVTLWHFTPKTRLGMLTASIATVGIIKRSINEYVSSDGWTDKYQVKKVGEYSDTVSYIFRQILKQDAEKVLDTGFNPASTIYICRCPGVSGGVYFLEWESSPSNASAFFTRSGDREEFETNLRELIWSKLANKVLLNSTSEEANLSSFQIVDKEYFGPNTEEELSQRLDLYGRIGETSRALLLVGAPGTGKSTIAQRLAIQRGGRIFKMSTDSDDVDIKIFELLEILRILQPSATIIDDLDKIQGTHQLLQLVEAIRQIPNTLLVATINDLSKIDPGLRRPGRFDDIILYDALEDPYHSQQVNYLIQQHNSTIDPIEAIESTRGLPPAYVKEAVLFGIATGLPVSTKVEHMKMIMGMTDDD